MVRGNSKGTTRVDWPTFWGAVCFLLIGGGFSIFGGYQLWTTWSFMADAVPVDATVIDNPANCDDDGCTWWPRLSLNDPFTVEREVRTRFGASNYGFGQGETVTVLSNPAYPYVRIPGASNLYLLGGGFFLIGFFPLAIAVWLLAKLTFTQPASTQKIE